ANPTGSVDVDPGSAVHNTMGGNANLICYNDSGNYVWNNHITPAYSYGVSNNSVACDSYGSSYVLSVGSYELTITRFSNTGVNLWSKTIGDFSSGARVTPQSVLVDTLTGNFYVAGTFDGTVNFSPVGTGPIYTSSSGFYEDGFIAKYDQNMNPIWVNQYIGKITFGNYSLDFDGNNLVAVGKLEGTINFGSGFSLTSTAPYNPFYLQLDSAGIALDGYTLSGSGAYNSITASVNHTFVLTGNIFSNTDMDPSAATLSLTTTVSSFFTAVYQFPIATSLFDITQVPNQNISIYPNPASGDVTLLNSTDETMDLQLMNALGKIVLSKQNLISPIKLDICSFPQGMYFIKVKTEHSFFTKKLIKN
ncbi:MAG: T9SS type A sorting domain-containing protein, partial [Flavobacterium sp.]